MKIDELVEWAAGYADENDMPELYWSLVTLKRIYESGDCNECRDKNECPIVPKPGERVRYNCAFFKKGEQA